MQNTATGRCSFRALSLMPTVLSPSKVAGSSGRNSPYALLEIEDNGSLRREGADPSQSRAVASTTAMHGAASVNLSDDVGGIAGAIRTLHECVESEPMPAAGGDIPMMRFVTITRNDNSDSDSDDSLDGGDGEGLWGSVGGGVRRSSSAAQGAVGAPSWGTGLSSYTAAEPFEEFFAADTAPTSHLHAAAADTIREGGSVSIAAALLAEAAPSKVAAYTGASLFSGPAPLFARTASASFSPSCVLDGSTVRGLTTQPPPPFLAAPMLFVPAGMNSAVSTDSGASSTSTARAPHEHRIGGSSGCPSAEWSHTPQAFLMAAAPPPPCPDAFC